MKGDLNRWLRIWHPSYQSLLLRLLLAGAIGAALIYLENALLHGLVSGLSGGDLNWVSSQLLAFATNGHWSKVAEALILLAALSVSGLAKASLEALKEVLSGDLTIKSRNDLEREVLRHLIRRDDSFFADHSLGEILNRLSVDLFRAMNRRAILVDAWWSVLLIGGNLLFFIVQDWTLALIAAGICFCGTLVTLRIGGQMKATDGAFVRTNDRIKADFEDYLRIVPEIQVGSLHERILRRFQRALDSRRSTFVRFTLASARVTLARGVWPVLAFTTMVLMVLASAGEGAQEYTLIPVLVLALPALFQNSSKLAVLRVQAQLGETSMQRLMEYETSEQVGVDFAVREMDEAQEATASTVELQDVTYRYSAAGDDQRGGVSHITAIIPPERWTAIVGGAGSGKSTLINLIVGRLRTQTGSVRIGGRSLSGDGVRIDHLATLAPQRAALLDSTIEDNILFGLSCPAGAEPTLNQIDMAVVEDIGLGHICRLKALDARPHEPNDPVVGQSIAALRLELRNFLASQNIKVMPYEMGHLDIHAPLMDAVIGGRSRGSDALLDLVTARTGGIADVAAGPLGEWLAGWATGVIEATRPLLRLETYNEFVGLAPQPLSQPVWRLRRSLIEASDAMGSAERRQMLVRVALTSLPAECGLDHYTLRQDALMLRQTFPRDIARLSDVLGALFEPFDLERLHPYLSWRDNLVYAVFEFGNQRRKQLADEILLRFVEASAWRQRITQEGLRYHVGRNGSRLSGGQGQLVSLVRSLLRRTPLVILDEPTSSLDPASRDRVAAFLKRWSRDHTVISVSHDLHLVRHCDHLLVLKSGHLESSGNYATLVGESAEFRRIFKLDSEDGDAADL